MVLSVLIADDHDIIREGIKSILQNNEEYVVCGEAGNGEEALHKSEELKPDILLLDITMPKQSGLDLIEQIKYILPDTKIIIITMHRANIYIDKAFNLGVNGYLLKENVVEDLLPALRCVRRGEVYINPKLSQYLIDRGTKDKEPDEENVILTERENDVLRLVVAGKTAKEIAEALFISPRTVENYKNNLLKKLNLHRTSDLIKYAIKHKIVDVEE
ncbi:MAG: response regulator transcription factor [PVC group bacterium]|nr:response regulator transcription factor [PVC group bacterium]